MFLDWFGRSDVDPWGQPLPCVILPERSLRRSRELVSTASFASSKNYSGLELHLLGPLDNAEEVAIRVFEDDKIVLRLVSPGVTLRPESQEPFNFSITGGCVKVKVQPTPPLSTTISCLKR